MTGCTVKGVEAAGCTSQDAEVTLEGVGALSVGPRVAFIVGSAVSRDGSAAPATCGIAGANMFSRNRSMMNETSTRLILG